MSSTATRATSRCGPSAWLRLRLRLRPPVLLLALPPSRAQARCCPPPAAHTVAPLHLPPA